MAFSLKHLVGIVALTVSDVILKRVIVWSVVGNVGFRNPYTKSLEFAVEVAEKRLKVLYCPITRLAATAAVGVALVAVGLLLLPEMAAYSILAAALTIVLTARAVFGHLFRG